eukprot:Sro80_g043080.2  (291) ;mRNA; f:56275-57147
MQPGHWNPPHTPPTAIATVAPSRNRPTAAVSAPPTAVATAIHAGQQGTSSLNILQATAVSSDPRASAPPALATALSAESIDSEVPLAQVVLMPNDTDSFRAPLVTAPLTAMRLGGDVVVLENYSSDADSQVGDSDAEESSTDVSWEGLRRELHRSLEDYTLLVQKASDPQWIPFLASLTPQQYATVILLTDIEPDQIKVAELLARHIKTHNHNTVFTCEHVIAGFESVARWARTNTLERTLPYCDPQDVVRNGDSIRNLLTDFELRVTRDILRDLHISDDVVNEQNNVEC